MLSKFKNSPKTISFLVCNNDCQDTMLSRKIDKLCEKVDLKKSSKNVIIPLKTVKSFQGKIQVMKYLHHPEMGHYLEAEFFLKAKIENNNLILG